MIKIIIFGIGYAYINRKEIFAKHKDRIHIIAFLDNNPEYQGKELDGIPIYKPERVKEFDFDRIVVLSKKFRQEMIGQLLSIGIKKNLIWDFNTLRYSALKGKRTVYSGKNDISITEKDKILIISTEMGFNGGTMVAVYAAQALKNSGYEVMLSAPNINEKLLAEIIEAGLSITIGYCLPYIFKEDETWINYYDIVIVNVFQMMNCANIISKTKPTLWWIHEDRSIWKSFYQDTQKEFQSINSSDWMKRLEVLGVSNVAKEAFNYFYPSIIKKSLPFGIPDRYDKEACNRADKSKIIFAVTAGFSIYKGQRVLVEAINKLPNQEKMQIEIWFIGPSGTNKQELEDVCIGMRNVRFLGLLSHEEVIKVLPQIDVVVCPSLIETMSMSTMEGMMFGKLCITTDMTGIAEYIEDGKNGFVVKANDSEQLAECISWIINNRDKWDPIKKAARKTYEAEFTLDVFGQRLITELKNYKEKFYENNINVSSSIS